MVGMGGEYYATVGGLILEPLERTSTKARTPQRQLAPNPLRKGESAVVARHIWLDRVSM